MVNRTMRRWAPVFAGAIGLGAAVALSATFFGGKRNPSQPETAFAATLDPATTDALSRVATLKVFFGHQSVGWNLLDAVPGLYSSSSSEETQFVQTSEAPAGAAWLAHDEIGRNGDPQSKFAALAATMRAGMGEKVDVALMKLCFLDITSVTDVNQAFDGYRTTMRQLEKEFPSVRFLYTTVPLTTDPNLKTQVKALLGRSPNYRADNAARERYNDLVRQEYRRTGRLFDIAAVESTTPSGQRLSGTKGGDAYFALLSAYASDEGHLNQVGATIAAGEMMRTIAGRDA